MTRSTTIIDTNSTTTSGAPESSRDPGGDDRHDRALLRRYATDGDVEALSELLQRHAGAAFRLACHFSANSHDAEDSVQVAALEIMKSAERFNEQRNGSVRLWIMGIVVNVCRRKRTENVRRAAREDKASGLRPAVDEAPVGASLDQEHLKLQIKQAVGTLPGLYRTPVSLHYYDGLSSGEIATVLRIPENTIRSQLQRGIEQLREMLLGAGTTLSIVELARLAGATPLENAGQELLRSLEHIARTGARPGQPSRTKGARNSGSSRQSKLITACAVVAAILLLMLLAFKAGFIAGPSRTSGASSATPLSQSEIQKSSNSDRILPKSAPDAAQAPLQHPQPVAETERDVTKLKLTPDKKIEENSKMIARLKKGVATVALTALPWIAGARAADFAKGPAPAAAPETAAAAGVPQLVDPGSADVSGYLSIPNVSQMLDHLDVIARGFNPQLPPGILKLQLGMTTGDPTLAGLDGSKPVVIMALKRAAGAPDQTPSLALFIPLKAAAPYDQWLKQMQFVSSFKDGLLVAAKTPDELTAAQAQIPAYTRIAADKGSADFRCYSSNKALLAAFKQTIEDRLNSITQSVASQSAMQSPPGVTSDATVNVLKLEMKAVLELLNEINSQQIDILFKGDTLCLDAIANAAPDSALSSLFVAPADTTNKMHGLLVSPGMVQALIKFVPGSTASFAQKFVDALASDPESAPLLTPDVKNYLKKCCALSNGDWAMSTQITADAKQHTEFGIEVKDAQSVHETYALLADATKPTGVLGKLYTSLGMKVDVTFNTSARLYHGVTISALKQKMDASSAVAPMKDMPFLGTNVEMGVIGNVLVGSSEPQDLDRMIDRAKAKEPPAATVSLESMTVFGPGKQFYFDYNVVELMKQALQAIPGNVLGPVLKQLSAAKPIIGAGLCDHGRAFVQVRVPLTPFIELQTLVMKANAAAAQPQAKDNATGETPEAKPQAKEEKF